MAISAVTLISNLDKKGNYSSRENTLAAADTVTFAAAGTLYAISGEISGGAAAEKFVANITFTIGQANNLRWYLFGLESTGGTEYLIPHNNTTEYDEVKADANGSRSSIWDVGRRFPIYKVYGTMGTDGGTNPTVTNVDVSIS
jgi:hypothetical protein